MVVRKLMDMVRDLAAWALRIIPSRAGFFLRRIAYRPFLRAGGVFDIDEQVRIRGVGNLSIGSGTTIEPGCTLICPSTELRIGKGCYLNQNTRIVAEGGAQVTIGDEVLIGPNVVMETSRHNDDRIDVTMKSQGMSYGPILIQDDVWICANAVITCGVTIGRGAIVGAGAVVTSDVPEHTVVGGVPARVIRKRSAD